MNKINDAEDSDIDNDEYSENYEVEVLSEVNLDKILLSLMNYKSLINSGRHYTSLLTRTT